MLKHVRRSGFTTIELMVVVAIIAVVLALAVPSYKEWLINSQIRAKAESVLSGLQLARVEALKRNTAVFFDLDADTSWVVGCVAAIADNDGDGIPDCPATIQKQLAGEGGNAVSLAITPGDSSRVTYNGMGMVKTPNVDGSQHMTQIDFDSDSLDSDKSRPMRILLTTGGVTRLCDPNITAAGDTRKC